MKKILSVFLAAIMIFSTMTAGFTEEVQAAKTPAGYLTMSIEASTLGLGFIEEPTKVPFYEGENVAEVTARFLKDRGRDFDYTGTIEGSFYLSQLETDWTDAEIASKMQIPQYILDMGKQTQQDYIDMGANGDGTLGEFCYGFMSGWMITSSVCKGLIPVGTSLWDAVDGDVIRWQFSLEGYGADLGYDNGWNEENGVEAQFVQADKDALYAVLGSVNVDTAAKNTLTNLPNYNDLMATTVKMQAKQGEIDSAVTSIYGETGVPYEYIATKGKDKTTISASSDTKPDANPDVIPTPPTTVNQAALDRLDTALDYMYKTVPAPALGTNFGEWSVLSLGRGGYAVSDTYYSDYIARLAQTMIDKNGVLHRVKKTENSRVVLALSSLGIEPFDIGGYDVTADLADFSNVCKQGINGPVFALIAMDTNDYKFAANADAADQNTRTKMLEYLFTKEISGGGFALSGSTPDPDMTAMTLEAFTSYVKGNALLKEEFGSDEAGYKAIITKVNEVVERGITTLSNLQQDDGDFASWGTINAESTAQTIVALVGLGIDPMTDARFITDTNKTLLDGLLKYSADEGGFKHTVDGSVNAMATDQATYALVAYERYVNGENRLYDMSDAFEDGNVTNPDQGQGTNPDPQVEVANVNISLEQDNYYVLLPQSVEVSSDLSDKYGYKDEVKEGVSALDVLIKAHEMLFDSAFTVATKGEYLVVADSGFITKVMGEETTDFGYAVNGLMPTDGVINEVYGTYTGYTMPQAEIKEDDTVQYFYYNPAGDYGEIYSNFSIDGERVTELDVTCGSEQKLSVEGYSYMYEGCNETIKWKPVKNAQIATVTMEGDTAGALVDMDKVVTDDKGDFTVKFDKPGTYYLAVNSNPDNFMYVIPQLLKITVKDNIIITTPDQILGKAGIEFNAVVTANAWTDSTIKLIDGVYNIPEGLEVVDITMGSSVTGGEIDYNLEEGKLRFAYMSETLGDIELTTETFPVELMTIKLKLVDKVTEEKDIEIAAEAMSFKTDSETSEELSVTNAKDSVTVLVPIPDPVASARILYTGDDSDLIDSTTQAVAVEILNLQETSKVMFGDIEMMYSAEMTAKKGVDTYVASTGTDITVTELNDMSNYTITAATPADITFADVNDDKVVNAQDSLDTLSFWLRKTEIENSKSILTSNVNGDSAINTFDVLAIMENVVNARELDIISK